MLGQRPAARKETSNPSTRIKGVSTPAQYASSRGRRSLDEPPRRHARQLLTMKIMKDLKAEFLTKEITEGTEVGG